MAVLRPIHSTHFVQSPARSVATFAQLLLSKGWVSPDNMMKALALHQARHGRLVDILRAHAMICEDDLYRALALHWQADRIDPAKHHSDPRLIDQIGAGTCLREGFLPWRQVGEVTVIATAYPEEFARLRLRLAAVFGTVVMALAPVSEIEAAILAIRGPALAHAAQTRVRESESCRNWGGGALYLGTITLLLVLAFLTWLAPLSLAISVLLWAMLTLFLATALKIAAAFAALRRPAPEGPAPIIARLPVVSVMVPLFREATIAPRLIRRLGKIDYPHELLEILLVAEEEDSLTRAALAKSHLPSWMRVVVVPQGKLKTKPRALNYALDTCRGSIIGIYDAEDAPAPDQIRRVVDRFHMRDAKVACLQGVLDFYNPRTNWLSRCFTMEYATWFRIILPGLARLGFAIPLGGTTLFFRRDALESLGGWDAHNVTEDADLGIRLARHGYRTELIDSTTEEEANCRALPWIKQRSRWLKGYMMTYAVHMQAPRLLLQQLGWWKFAGFQVFFLTTLTQFLLAPVLWSFWIVPLGFYHPILAALPEWLQSMIFGTLILSEGTLLAVTILGMRLSPTRLNPLWAPMLHFYFPLGALASYKAAWEMVSKPFYWDKTSHGHFDPLEAGKKP